MDRKKYTRLTFEPFSFVFTRRSHKTNPRVTSRMTAQTVRRRRDWSWFLGLIWVNNRPEEKDRLREKCLSKLGGKDWDFEDKSGWLFSEFEGNYYSWGPNFNRQSPEFFVA